MTALANLVVRPKGCPSCGTRFDCCAGRCWCDEVPLADAVRAELGERYEDCLCPGCLRAIAQSRATSSCPLASSPSTSSSAD